MTIDPARWYPVAAADDLPHGHVYRTALDGEGLALWRDRGGAVNIWEDRCPHRGVRFSIGEVAGDELRCQYHAWRYASESGACTHIPAQPDKKPAAAIRATVWPVAETGGLVWTGRSPQGIPLTLGDGPVLRSIPVNRPASAVELQIGAIAGAALVVQPVDAGRSVIRGIATGIATGRAIREVDTSLEALRRDLEAVSC